MHGRILTPSTGTHGCAKKLDYFPTGDTDDGIFWMSLSDFVSNYRQIYICRLFSTVDEGGNWYKYTVSSEWLGETAGGCNGDTVELNPQFHIDVREPSNIFISLTQYPKHRNELNNIGFSVLDKEGNRIKRQYSSQTYARTSYTNLITQTHECYLLPKSKPYTLLPTTYYAGKECTFMVVIYSDKALGSAGNILPQLDPRTVPSS